MPNISWAELTVLLTPIPEAARLKGISRDNAKTMLKNTRKKLIQQGWIFQKEQVGESTVIVAAIPPDGVCIEEWLKTHRLQGMRPEQAEYWSDREKQTGRPLLSWREMAILGWSNERAQKHRGSNSLEASGKEMQLARKKLREEGWIFTSDNQIIPPQQLPETSRYIQERADAQQRSNWLLRIPEA